MLIYPVIETPFLSTVLANLYIRRSEISIVSGAACGAIIYNLNLTNISLCRRLLYFLVSFLLGIHCAEGAVNLFNSLITKFINPPPQINVALSAALVAAVAVRLINVTADNIINRFPGNKRAL